MKNSLKEKIYAQGYPDAKTAPMVSPHFTKFYLI